VGGDREEGEQVSAVRTQEKRETESMAGGAYAVLKYVSCTIQKTLIRLSRVPCMYVCMYVVLYFISSL
jgi:hypothetical protein